jgi:hypothetical protein
MTLEPGAVAAPFECSVGRGSGGFSAGFGMQLVDNCRERRGSAHRFEPKVGRTGDQLGNGGRFLVQGRRQYCQASSGRVHEAHQRRAIARVQGEPETGKQVAHDTLAEQVRVAEGVGQPRHA